MAKVLIAGEGADEMGGIKYGAGPSPADEGVQIKAHFHCQLLLTGSKWEALEGANALKEA